MTEKEENFIDISDKEIKKVVKIELEENEVYNKIEMDSEEDNKKVINDGKLSQHVTKIDILEMKLEHLYEDVYNEIVPKFKNTIREINDLKDITKCKLSENNIKVLINEYMAKNEDKLIDLLIEKSNKLKEKLNEYSDIDEEEELENNEIKRKNFLFFSTKKEEMDGLYANIVTKKNLADMVYAVNERSGPPKYYIIGKFTTQSRIDYKNFKNIKFLEGGHNYMRSYDIYIKPNTKIDEFHKKNK